MDPNQQTAPPLVSAEQLQSSDVNFSSDVWVASWPFHSFFMKVHQCTLSLAGGRLRLMKAEETLFDAPLNEIRIKLKASYYDEIIFKLAAKKFRVYFKPNMGRLGTYTDFTGERARDWRDALVKAGADVKRPRILGIF